MTIKRLILSLGLVYLASGFANTVMAETLAVRGDGTDSVYFRSSAKLEFIEGVSNDLVGSVGLNREDPSKSTGRFRVDLRTLRTGIETRDKHMRDRHLDTDEFPFAYLELTGLKGFSPDSPVGVKQTCQGVAIFYIRGAKRSMAVDLVVATLSDEEAGGGFQIRASFPLVLDEYHIPRPKLLFLKLAELIEVEIVMVLHPVPADRPSSFPSFPSFPDFELIE